MVKALDKEKGKQFEDVICMQEVAMTDAEAEAFKRGAGRHGYRGCSKK